MADENKAHLQEINEEIYKRNLELAIVNKTLSLLRKLYQISLQALDPATLSEKVSETVRVDLNMEVVGIFSYSEEKDILTPFKFSESERLAKTIKDHDLKFDQEPLKDDLKPLLKQVVHEQKPAITEH